MAVTAPLTPQQLESLVAKFIGDAREKAAGGLTVAEFGSLLVGLLRLAVAGLEGFPTDGAAKKAWAIHAVGVLFDNVADACVPMLLKPVWFVSRPAVRMLVLAVSDGALEQVLAMIRQAGPGIIIPFPEPTK